MTKRGVKMAGFLAISFCVFMDRDEVEVSKNAKRELGQLKQSWPYKLVN